MNQDNHVRLIENRITGLLQEEPGYFIVDISIKPTNNIKVFIDADQGATIDRLTKLNRALYKWLEESLFPNGDFSLEVSSPGLDEPIRLYRQYVKNIGRFAEVLEKEGNKKEGKLVSVTEHEIIIEEIKGKGKKTEFIQHRIPFEQIKSTKIQIKF